MKLTEIIKSKINENKMVGSFIHWGLVGVPAVSTGCAVIYSSPDHNKVPAIVSALTVGAIMYGIQYIPRLDYFKKNDEQYSKENIERLKKTNNR